MREGWTHFREGKGLRWLTIVIGKVRRVPSSQQNCILTSKRIVNFLDLKFGADYFLIYQLFFYAGMGGACGRRGSSFMLATWGCHLCGLDTNFWAREAWQVDDLKIVIHRWVLWRPQWIAWIWPDFFPRHGTCIFDSHMTLSCGQGDSSYICACFLRKPVLIFVWFGTQNYRVREAWPKDGDLNVVIHIEELDCLQGL